MCVMEVGGGGSISVLLDLYSMGAWFNSRPEQWLSWLKLFVVFHSRIVFQLGHAASFQILFNMSSHHRMLWSLDSESVVKSPDKIRWSWRTVKRIWQEQTMRMRTEVSWDILALLNPAPNRRVLKTGKFIDLMNDWQLIRQEFEIWSCYS
jgi:hypothetical protein